MAAPVRQTSHFALRATDGIEVCKAMGLAIGNVAMYGMEHSVTAGSLSQAFDTLVNKMDIYGAIELVLADAGLLINGSVVEPARTTGQLLVDQMDRNGVHDVELMPSLGRLEFSQFMSILASAPASLPDGFGAAVSKLGLECVRVSNVNYTRVEDAATEPETVAETVGEERGTKSFDLDADFNFDEFMMGVEPEAAASRLSVVSAASSYLAQKQAAELQRQQLVDMIRDTVSSGGDLTTLRAEWVDAGMDPVEWHALLVASGIGNTTAAPAGQAAESLQRLLQDVHVLAAQGEAIADGENIEKMTDLLDGIRDQVTQLASQTQGHVTTLVDKVDADRETVAKLEKDAREQGIGLSLSRDELLSSLAEINQELAQPLCAASAIVDVLGAGRLGEVSEAQRDGLAVASQGLERLGKLVSYLTEVSGLPTGLSPDRVILDDAYGANGAY